MIEANEMVFRKLRNSVDGEKQYRLERIEKQHIATDKSEKDWLQHLRIHGNYRVVGINVVSLIEFQNTFYIIFPHDQQFSPAQISAGSSFSANAGVATALWASPEYRPLRDRGSSDRIVEVIGSVQKCMWTDVAKLFPPLCMYRLSSTPLSDVRNSSLRTYAEYLIVSQHEFTLPFTRKTSGALLSLLAGNAGAIGPSAILRALLASNWSHAYLDLFRLIEHLYSAPFLQELVSGLGISAGQSPRSVRSIRGIVERSLAWKPKEASALDKLFVQIPDGSGVLQDLSVALKTDADARKIAACIYTIRNEIAHFRESGTIRSDEEWDTLIGSLASTVQTLYDNCFHEYCSDHGP
ncbi:hypothetical protein OV203_47210 [Nannocystis sp. ILAH1]|uniref:hypothetical protein n=1 Tax=Nannocystis sp. ILAH1 TaxID=2996789 RepID=UPI00226D5D47|nr:hypothetical protein [Nannocystis sp. ILAH1]MCY0994807.1 hypothetical protein [Nannocystis sp. ILAH1]